MSLKLEPSARAAPVFHGGARQINLLPLGKIFSTARHVYIPVYSCFPGGGCLVLSENKEDVSDRSRKERLASMKQIKCKLART